MSRKLERSLVEMQATGKLAGQARPASLFVFDVCQLERLAVFLFLASLDLTEKPARDGLVSRGRGLLFNSLLFSARLTCQNEAAVSSPANVSAVQLGSLNVSF